jgi:aerobic-type carbon monoxide dehydrogenase small subunit (CoxS/CutS family)
VCEPIEINVNGREILVQPGTKLAVALVLHGIPCRTSVRGEARTALCGMGICFECTVTVDGRRLRSCQIDCAPGMQVETDD